MKKLFAFVLMLLLCGLAVRAYADDDELSLISCPEQGFMTKTDPSYVWTTDAADGLCIYLDEKGELPFVHVSWFPAVTSVDEARDYMSENVGSAIRKKYDDGPFQSSVSAGRSLGGKELPAGEFMYKDRGERIMMTLAFDTAGPATVVYQAKYTADDKEEALEALDNAIRYFKPGKKPKPANANPVLVEGLDAAKTPDGEPEQANDGLSTITCPQQGFTTKADPAYAWEFRGDTGINIWTGTKGYIPYVLVFRTDGKRRDSYKYFREKFTPEMENDYGDNLVSAKEYKEYEIGGKKLAAGLYSYRVNGRLIEMLRIEDNTGDRTVQYTAKYAPKRECYPQEKDQEENTLAALDAAIRNFRADTDAGSSAPAPAAAPVSAAPQPVRSAQPKTNVKIVKAQSKKIEFEKYDDGLISMDIPRGWKVFPHPLMMDAAHYTFQVVNPQNRDYQIYFNFKWEAGNFSTEKERQWWAKNIAPHHPQQFDASKLPAINPQNTEGFFKAWNKNWAALGGFKCGDFIAPKMNNFTVVEKLDQDLGGDVLHASFKNDKGGSVDGVFLAVMHKFNLSLVNMVWGCPISYVTAPSAEFEDWTPALIKCLNTVKFSDTFMRNFNSQMQTSAKASAEIARIGSETSDIITKGWEARQKTYDVLSQKRSDATMGYERVYDTETGEVYKAYNGFTDDIKTDNSMSRRYKPATDDMYRKGIDGYIEK